MIAALLVFLSGTNIARANNLYDSIPVDWRLPGYYILWLSEVREFKCTYLETLIGTGLTPDLLLLSGRVEGLKVLNRRPNPNPPPAEGGPYTGTLGRIAFNDSLQNGLIDEMIIQKAGSGTAVESSQMISLLLGEHGFKPTGSSSIPAKVPPQNEAYFVTFGTLTLKYECEVKSTTSTGKIL